MSDLHDGYILSWSEPEAGLFRPAAAGKPVDEPLDRANIIAAIADVGRGALRACRSHLSQVLPHDLRACAWPLFRDVPHWQSEARVMGINVTDANTPSLRQLIDNAGFYARTLRAVPHRIDGQPPLPAPAACPVRLTRC